MITTFTQDDVLRYVYKETTKEESKDIEIALKHDKELRAFYDESLHTIGLVNMAMLEPSNLVIEKILKMA
jgi:hypothetical protein